MFLPQACPKPLPVKLTNCQAQFTPLYMKLAEIHAGNLKLCLLMPGPFQSPAIKAYCDAVFHSSFKVSMSLWS